MSISKVQLELKRLSTFFMEEYDSLIDVDARQAEAFAERLYNLYFHAELVTEANVWKTRQTVAKTVVVANAPMKSVDAPLDEQLNTITFGKEEEEPMADAMPGEEFTGHDDGLSEPIAVDENGIDVDSTFDD